MKLVGLTGGIGMGKSTSAQLLRERSIPVVDTDDLARRIVQPDQPALAEIVRAFGPAIIAADGTLRREELARRVFADPIERQALESILHPRIRELWRSEVGIWRAQGHRVGVVVIPLLFETHAEEEFDVTICVACSSGTQRERLVARGWPPRQIEQRIEAQLAVAEKIARASFLIWTEAGVEIHAAQLDRVLLRVGCDQ